MDYTEYKKKFRKTPGRYDITPLFQDYALFQSLIEDLLLPFNNVKIDKVAGLDALGFILGAPVALKLQKGFVPIRKGGKLPGSQYSIIKKKFIDYSKTEKIFELNKNAIKKGECILIVDDWIETGNQIKAAAHLIKEQGGIVAGISAITIEKNENTKELLEKYTCHSINKHK